MERQVLADRQGLLASGVRGEGLPSLEAARDAFREWLATEPKRVDQAALDRAELDRALKGVA